MTAPVLTRAEERAMFEAMAAAEGNERATIREQIFEANIGLIYFVVNGWTLPSDYERGDAESDAAIGLLKAIDLFDPARGNKFSSYAVKAIKATLRRSLDTYSSPKVPVRARIERRHVDRLADRVRASGVAPTPELLADELGWQVEDVVTLLTQDSPLSLDAPLDEADGDTLGDVLTGTRDTGPALIELEDLLARASAFLTDAERDVLSTMVRNRPVSDVAEARGFSRQWASQLRLGVIAKLQHPVFGGWSILNGVG